MARVYEMGFADGVWKLLRIAPGFSQRFPGTFDETGDKAEQVPESEIERGLAVFSSVSETQGAGAWKRSDVQAPRQASALPRHGPGALRSLVQGRTAARRARVAADVVLVAQLFMRVATLYFVTDVRCPGVSPAGIALKISSPFW